MPGGPDVVEATAMRVAARLTPQIQNLALEHGWPKNVVARLSLTQSDGILFAKYSGPTQEVEDLEYGTVNTAPKAAISNFFNSHRYKREIQKNTTQSMDEIVSAINRLFS